MMALQPHGNAEIQRDKDAAEKEVVEREKVKRQGQGRQEVLRLPKNGKQARFNA